MILPRIVNLVSTIALLVATAMPGFAVENLQLDRTTGSAPLTVKVIQPSVLVERLEDWKKAKSRAGPGGYVNWVMLHKATIQPTCSLNRERIRSKPVFIVLLQVTLMYTTGTDKQKSLLLCLRRSV